MIEGQEGPVNFSHVISHIWFMSMYQYIHVTTITWFQEKPSTNYFKHKCVNHQKIYFRCLSKYSKFDLLLETSTDS